MYIATIILSMLVFPALSIAIELLLLNTPFTMLVLAKWFVFWAVGVRLFPAGLRQIAQPEFTQRILGITGTETRVLVRELGFGNVAFGALGLGSLFVPEWRIATAFAAAIFYLLAGINHWVRPHRNRMENVAMLSDLFAALVLGGIVVAAWLGAVSN